jgi:roadblock/LC7 domain-containing protein
MTVPGALAAFEFRGSGELLAHETIHSETFTVEALDLLAHVCAANASIAAMQARGWESVTGMKGFYPVRESSLLGLEWSVIVSGASREAQIAEGKDLLSPFVGVVVDNNECDYEAAFAALETYGGER